MKFKDPLATLKYMGGPPSVHLFMAIYAGIAYYNYGNNFYCSRNYYQTDGSVSNITITCGPFSNKD